jgi:hypothetical protein
MKIDGFHALAANPLVYQYLFDGFPPDKEYIARRVVLGDRGNGVVKCWRNEKFLPPNRCVQRKCMALQETSRTP